MPRHQAIVTLLLGITGLAVCALLPLLAMRALHLPNDLWLVQAWFNGRQAGNDSWTPLANALDYVNAHGGAGLYQTTYFASAFQFLYPPTSLVVVRLTDQLGLLDWHSINEMNRACWPLVPAIMSALACLTLAVLHRQGTRLGPMHFMLAAALGIAATLLYYPFLIIVREGQIQNALNLLIILSMLFWTLDRKAASGIAIGLVCIIKPQLGILLVWAVLRREWRFAAALALTGVAVCTASIAMFGWQVHLEYLDLLGFLSRRGESYIQNQGLNGVLNRMLFIGNNLVWDGTHRQITYDARVHFATLAGTVTLIGLALFYRMRAVSQPLDFAFALVTFTLASPVAYNYHFGMLPATFILVLFALRAWHVGGKYYWWLAAVVLLTANRFGITDLLAGSRLNILQSHFFFGLILLIGLLLQVSRLADVPPPRVKAMGAQVPTAT